MIYVGTNAAGLLNKKESFLRIIEKFEPAVFFIQETKARRKNKIKLKDYLTFEHIIIDRKGGGLLTAIHRNLKPVSIPSNEDTEVLFVEANINNVKTRFINAYGPPENCDEDITENF